MVKGQKWPPSFHMDMENLQFYVIFSRMFRFLLRFLQEWYVSTSVRDIFLNKRNRLSSRQVMDAAIFEDSMDA